MPLSSSGRAVNCQLRSNSYVSRVRRLLCRVDERPFCACMCICGVLLSLSVASVTVPPMAASIIRVFVGSNEERPQSRALCGGVREQSAPKEQLAVKDKRHCQRRARKIARASEEAKVCRWGVAGVWREGDSGRDSERGVGRPRRNSTMTVSKKKIPPIHGGSIENGARMGGDH